MFFKVITVAALASFELYAAIPAGFAFGLPAWIILLASVTGGVSGVFIAAFLGDRVRRFFYRDPKPKNEKPKTGLVHRIWNKYGIIGLGILGTISVGAPISIAVGVGFNAPLRKLITWCCIGVITRCLLFTFIGYHGAKLF